MVFPDRKPQSHAPGQQDQPEQHVSRDAAEPLPAKHARQSVQLPQGNQDHGGSKCSEQPPKRQHQSDHEKVAHKPCQNGPLERSHAPPALLPPQKCQDE